MDELFWRKVTVCILAVSLIALSGVEGEDVALNKPVYVSSALTDSDPRNANNGNEEDWFSSGNKGGRQFVIIDLQGLYLIEEVEILGHGGSFGEFEVFLGLDYDKNKIDATLASYSTCGEVWEVKDLKVDVKCRGFGRFIGVRKYKADAHIEIADFKVHGIKQKGADYDQRKPESNLASRMPSVIFRGTASPAAQITDGKMSTCVSFDKKDQFAIINMGTVNFVSTVFAAFAEGQAVEFDVLVGQTWDPSDSDAINQFSLCEKVRDISTTRYEVGCRATYGSVIAIRYLSGSRSLCEVEVYGQKEPFETTELPNAAAPSNSLSTNVAYDKKIYIGNWLKTTYTAATDGYGYSYIILRNGRFSFFTLDLESTYKVDTVKITFKSGYSVGNGAEILLGREWNKCRPYLRKNFAKCGDIKAGSSVVSLRCKSMKARYLLFRLKPGTKMNVAEVQVFSSSPAMTVPYRPSDIWRKDCSFLKDKNVNIARGKPVYSSTGRDAVITNGYLEGSCWSGKKGDWYVIDLAKVYKVKAVRFTGVYTRHKDNSNFEIRLLRTFSPCRPQNIKLGTLCNRIGDGSRYMTLECFGTGQFVAMYFHGKETSYTCEVEVFGDLQAESTPYDVHPSLPTEDYKEPGIKLPNIRDTIVRGVDKLDVKPYIGSVYPLSLNAESILQHPGDFIPGLVASTVGSGRVFGGGNPSQLDTLKKQSNRFWKQAAQWLANSDKPRFYTAEEVDETKFTTPGGIVLWNGEKPISPDKAKLIRKLALTGKAGVFYTLQGIRYRDLDSANLDLMLEAGIYFGISHYSFFYPRTLDMKVKDKAKTLSFAYRIHKLLESTHNFVFDGLSTLEAINKFPPKAVEAMNITDAVLKLERRYTVYAQKWAPCSSHQLTDETETLKNVQRFIASYGALMRSAALVDSTIKAPNVDLYPGAIPAGSPRQSIDLEIVASTAQELHPTGLYLPPGGTLVAEVLSTGKETNLDEWSVYISCHTDYIGEKGSWMRFPQISNNRNVRLKKIYSGFGGVVMIRNDDKDAGTIKLRLKGAVRAPFFNLRDPQNMAKWDNDRRHAPAPWAEIAGDAMIYCVPSKDIRSYTSEYMKELMGNYIDKMVKGDHHLRGTNWRTSRRERFSVDLQISQGWGHNGYPMMGQLPWSDSLLILDDLRKDGAWGLFHEVGHNMQDYKWTFSGTIDVTNNIFALFNRHQYGLSFYEHFHRFSSTFRFNIIKSYLNASPVKFSRWRGDFFLALAIYAQFGHQFGWAFYKETFRKYITDKLNPTEYETRIETWIITTSQACKYNLIPTFDFWGFPISQKVRDTLKGSTYFLPNDFITKAVPKRVSYILAKYSGTVRSAPKMPDPYAAEMKEFSDVLPNDVIVL